jgi:undecaprenyl-diphosphatase
MDFVLVVLLGAIQGLTEFLPISSDGHLAIAMALYSAISGQTLSEPLALTIVLHAGTLLAILVFYRRRLLQLLGEDRRVVGLLIVGSLPAAIVGLTLEMWFEERTDQYLTDPLLAGLMLPITGALLLWGSRSQPGDTTYQQMTWKQALVIGMFQAAAILPGISRSGSTITAALALGIRPDSAATFSFLLAVPVVGGACALKLAKLLSGGTTGLPGEHLVLGTLVSLVVGLFSLWWLIRWLQQGRLHYFAWWCLALGLVVVAWQLTLVKP